MKERMLRAAACGAILAMILSPAWAPAAEGEGPSPASPPASAETRGRTAAQAPAEPLALTVQGAILQGLQNNRAFIVQRYQPLITRTAEEKALSVFDPVVGGTVSQEVSRAPSGAAGDLATTRTTDVSATLDKTFTPGTKVNLEASVQGRDSTIDSGTSRLAATVTQPLARGGGSEVNLAALSQARLDSRISDYELRGLAADLVAQVEEAYWDYSLAERNIAIYEESLTLAQRQLDETNERIKVGKLAEVERLAAEAEMALRREDSINARSTLETTRLSLLRLVSPPGGDPLGRAVILRDEPVAPAQGAGTLEEHLTAARRLRPEVNQARLQIERGDLELVKTRNGLLPKLDFFLTLGRTGYADSFSESVTGGRGGYDVQAGLTLQLPIYNRSAKADNLRATLSREQSLEALANLEELAQVDVRRAYIEVRRLQEQMAATAASRRLQEEKYRGEIEKFQVGRSTSFLVAQSERDLVQSRVAEVQATVGYLKAMVELYRLDGSLLERRGISAPPDRPMPPVAR